MSNTVEDSYCHNSLVKKIYFDRNIIPLGPSCLSAEPEELSLLIMIVKIIIIMVY